METTEIMKAPFPWFGGKRKVAAEIWNRFGDVGNYVNPCNDKITIEATDAPGAGGANHLYQITGFNTGTNPSCPFTERYGKPSDHTTILFQNGTIPENGTNGITQEVLLAIVADRLACFQAGKFACAENRVALEHIKCALSVLKWRTLRRIARNVEGTHTV